MSIPGRTSLQERSTRHDAGDHALRLGSSGPGAVGSAGFSLRLSLSVALVDPANYPEEARKCFNHF